MECAGNMRMKRKADYKLLRAGNDRLNTLALINIQEILTTVVIIDTLLLRFFYFYHSSITSGNL